MKLFFSVFNTTSPNFSYFESSNELTSISWLKEYSNIIFPFVSQSITNKIQGLNISGKETRTPFQMENEIIAETISMIVSPIISKSTESRDLFEISKLLGCDNNFKFVSTNMYPLLIDDYKEITSELLYRKCFKENNFSGSTFAKYLTQGHLIILRGNLQNSSPVLENKILEFSLKNVINNNKCPENLFYPDWNNPILGFKRMLVCSNSSCIYQLLQKLHKQLETLKFDETIKLPLSNVSSHIVDILSNSFISLDSFISYFQKFKNF